MKNVGPASTNDKSEMIMNIIGSNYDKANIEEDVSRYTKINDEGI